MNELPERQVVVFEVGEDHFALDILQIREIARYQKLRRIPKAPSFLSGVIDLRGTEIVPIIDLHDRLEIEATVDRDKSRIIIAPVDNKLVGFLVDVVRDVTTIPGESIEAPPSAGSAPNFLEGVIRTDEEIILLLDVTNVLTSDEKLEMEELRRSLTQDRKQGKGKGKRSSSGRAASKGSGAKTSGSKRKSGSGSKGKKESTSKSGSTKKQGAGASKKGKQGSTGKGSKSASASKSKTE